MPLETMSQVEEEQLAPADQPAETQPEVPPEEAVNAAEGEPPAKTEPTAASEPPAPPGATDWVELCLVDGNGNALAGKRYRVIASDGQVVEDSLDANGCARVTGLPAGECTVEFPDPEITDFELAGDLATSANEALA